MPAHSSESAVSACLARRRRRIAASRRRTAGSRAVRPMQARLVPSAKRSLRA
jgi:hypothetical protein